MSVTAYSGEADHPGVMTPGGATCARGQKARRDGYSVVCRRASRLFDELVLARADGTLPHLLERLAKAQVLIPDDFGLDPAHQSARSPSRGVPSGFASRPESEGCG